MSKIENTQNKIKKLYEFTSEPSFSIPKELQAYELAHIAIEFLAAASILEKKRHHLINPQLQLTGHAIECSMKACIASVSAKPSNSHDLVKLYKIIENNGFRLEDRLQAMIVHLNHSYYQDLRTGTKFKLRYPTETSENSGGTYPLHSDMVAIINSLIDQAARRVPDTYQEMFRTISTYRENLENLVGESATGEI